MNILSTTKDHTRHFTATHPSEAAHHTWEPDITVANDGELEELRNRINALWNDIQEDSVKKAY